jgi:hypothetical protein
MQLVQANHEAIVIVNHPQSKPTKKAAAHIVQRMMKEMNFHFDTFKKSLQTNWKCSKICVCVWRVFHAHNISGGNFLKCVST